MSNIQKKPYEISLWQDELVFKIQLEDGTIIEIFPEQAELYTNYTLLGQYYREKKIANIGSNLMAAEWRAVSPILIRNVNGSNTLSFTMYSRYIDALSGEKIDNPFIKLLVNERKVKLHYDNKWYDFVIKNVQENSEAHSFTYAAKDLFINELSKNGFSLEYNTELENNQGTVIELGESILEGSDWRIDKDNSDILRQYIEEPLYKITLKEKISATDMLQGEEIDLEAGTEIYAFYNCIANETPFFQFLYAESYEIDDDRIIVNSPNYCIDGVSYIEGAPLFSSFIVLSNDYRGKRLVRKPITKYDSTIDKYVSVYEENDQEIYGYTNTEYLTTDLVRNFITNSSAFTNTDGWRGSLDSGNKIMDISIETDPLIEDLTVEEVQAGNFHTFLNFKFTESSQLLKNACVSESRQHIGGFVEGEKYVIRIKYKETSNLFTSITVNKYLEHLNRFELEDEYMDFIVEPGEDGYYYGIAECSKSISYKEMLTTPIALFFGAAPGEVIIEEIEFFKHQLDGEDNICLPGQPITPIVKTIYNYYYPDNTATSESDIEFIYSGEIPASYKQKFTTNYEKVRSITASESNRFNLIQSLCETFECWAKFEIEHNEETGEVLLDEELQPKKFISFHEFIGKDNPTGFKYGINLKSTQRTLESDAIVSKLIVKNNSNEFAENGFCSIARAEENVIKENFILDFSYYIQQGLLSFSEVNNDLYLDINGYIGYYKRLREINKDVDSLSLELAEIIGSALPPLEADSQAYYLAKTKAEEVVADNRERIERTTNFTLEYLLDHKENDWWQDKTVSSLVIATLLQIDLAARNDELYETASAALQEQKEKKDEIEAILKDKLAEKEELNKAFYQKYSQFIQEGPWISEDYVDDNLYYLDSVSTLHTSSQPKVSYTINVIEISQIEGYEGYNFEIGDKTHIEDTEFFGWVYKNGIKTPYREEIVVSEIKTALDSPEQNQIRVQNYKTQFEDLFQRITATTASVQFSTGEYQKAAAAIEPNGTINQEVLQNSMLGNAVTLQNSNDNSVVFGAEGIVTTDLTQPNNMVRIVGGGIFLSNDFGSSWNTGITAKGINANYLTAGQINTNVVQIMSGSFPTFRWDELGLNAYKFDLENGRPTNFSASNFVRFDHYGIYGIEGKSGFAPISEQEVWDNANFGLTWRGFFLKNSDGSVRISSDSDIQVLSGADERIKIGRILTDSTGTHYGIIIKDDNQNVVMRTADDGTLWLESSLNIKCSSDNKEVKIGSLGREQDDLGSGNRVIDASNKFIVWEDGTIQATSGKIGNVTIQQVEDKVLDKSWSCEIESDGGFIITEGVTSLNLTAKVYDENGNPKTPKVDWTFTWYQSGSAAPIGTGVSINYAISGEFSRAQLYVIVNTGNDEEG